MPQLTQSLRTDSLRTIFWGFWFFVLPAALAYGCVVWLGGHDIPGPFDEFARDQRVPAGIVVFTLVEGIVWYFRHRLPFSEPFSIGREGLPTEMRRDFEAAGHLLDDSERILARNEASIAAKLGKETTTTLTRRLTLLKESMLANPFDAEQFQAHFVEASEMSADRLAPWRKGELREYAESISVAIIVALLLRAIVFEAFKIPSGSMLPTLQIGDHIFVSKFAYGPKLPLVDQRVMADMPPRRGDVIVFEFPDLNEEHERQDYIKRVVAIPGDVLEADSGHPIINGWRVPNCRVGHYNFGEQRGFGRKSGELFVEYLEDTAYLALYRDGVSPGRRQGPYHVAPGEVWVMGDNRNNSLDSRAWANRNGGTGAGVPYENIKGRAMIVWLPAGRMFVNVMGKPLLPEGADPQLVRNIDRCLASRPSPDATRPPPPRP